MSATFEVRLDATCNLAFEPLQKQMVRDRASCQYAMMCPRRSCVRTSSTSFSWGRCATTGVGAPRYSFFGMHRLLIVARHKKPELRSFRPDVRPITNKQARRFLNRRSTL
jgi:hypothetical protein